MSSQSATDEVVDLVSQLIRFDTSNTGEPETTKGEEECAKWVAQQLEEVGYTTLYVESGRPGRGNVFTRLPGADWGRAVAHAGLGVTFIGISLLMAWSVEDIRVGDDIDPEDYLRRKPLPLAARLLNDDLTRYFQKETT